MSVPVYEPPEGVGLDELEDELARAFLASPEAAYVTGQVLVVCGGRSVAA